MVRLNDAPKILSRATLCALLVLAGCTSAPTPPPGAPEPPAPTTREPSPSAPPGPQRSLTLALHDQAEAQQRSGDFDGAITTLERAIRIDPGAPELWLLLGQVNLDAGDAPAAEQFARKALQFTTARPDLEQQAWSLIDRARQHIDGARR